MSATLADARRAYDGGDFAGALSLARATAAATGELEALVLVVNAGSRLGAHDDVLAALEALHAHRPDDARFRRVLSTALSNAAARGARADPEAIPAYDRALALWPDNTDAMFNRALAARRAGDAALADALLGRAVALRPDDLELVLEHAAAGIAAGRADAPSQLAAVSKRADAAVLERAAVIAAGAGLTRITADVLARIGSVTAALDAAGALAEHGEIHAARRAYARAAEIGRHGVVAPSLRGRLGERLALAPVHDDRASIAASRQRFAEGVDSLERELDDAALGSCERTLDQLQWSNFLLAYHGEDDLELQSRYGDFAARAAARLASVDAPVRASDPRRVAVVSGFLRETTVGAYFGSWIGALRSAGFEVDAYALGPRHDATTDRLGAEASRLLRVDGPLDPIATAIRASGAGLVLYPELGMDARVFALAALRLAPVQACAWGHPVTSGLPTIDAFFSCEAMEPDDAGSHYRERLLRLPGPGTVYRAPPAPAPRDRETLGLPAGRLYFVPQAAFKLHPDNDAVLADVARRDPGARIVLFENERRGVTGQLRARLARAFVAHDADASRLLFLPLTSRTRYLEIGAACDVMIDTLHWSGGNTSLDALRGGLPVVTCPGRFMRGRQTAAMLALLDLSGPLVVAGAAALAERAVEIARDRSRRAELSQRITRDFERLLDGRVALERMAAHCRELAESAA